MFFEDRTITLLLRYMAGILLYAVPLGCTRASTMMPRTADLYLKFDSTYSQGLDSAGEVKSGREFVAQASGFPPLRTAVLPVGTREMRFSPVPGGMVWSPSPLLRLIEMPDQIIGELYFYWGRLRDSVGYDIQPHWVTYASSGCQAVQQSSQWAMCRLKPRQGISWKAVADSLQALGIWELPTRQRDGIIRDDFVDSAGVRRRRMTFASDQDGVAAEMLIGSVYRHLWYYDLDRLDGDDVPRVRAAAELVNSLLAQ
jgi:hypothetical protein